MVSKRKKQYESGEGSRYMSRSQALRYLQLSLADFRRLCILKGVYPREPRNRKRAQRGAPDIRILYLKKDIQFLSHEPNVWKIREFKQVFRRIRRAEGMQEFDQKKKLQSKMPVLNLDHIVKERYPTFMDAIRDLDDCLTLLFLFASFPHRKMIPEKIINTCRRLTVEFMHYVIASQALIKVFISIKGYYFQAEIKGELVTWIVPHNFTMNPVNDVDVDFKIMTNFVDFYMIMLGFVNFRLYHSINLAYPPKFQKKKVKCYQPQLLEVNHITKQDCIAELIASLNVELTRSKLLTENEDVELDKFPMVENEEKMEEAAREMERRRKLKTLFKGLKFFLGREVPREPLVFIIRCMGGQVSWSKTSSIGATYDENDESITHQIVDRPLVDTQYISRYYVQPQWVFDSVNVGELRPVQNYFIGKELPPHLSPFHSEHKLDKYIPLEEAALTDPALAAKLAEASNYEDEEAMENDEEMDVDPLLLNNGSELSDEILENLNKYEEEYMKERECANDDEERECENDEEERECENDERAKKIEMMSVTGGKVVSEDPYAEKKLRKEEYSLRVSMIKNKHRKLFHSMVAGRKKRGQEAWLLRKKRLLLESKEKERKKAGMRGAKKGEC